MKKMMVVSFASVLGFFSAVALPTANCQLLPTNHPTALTFAFDPAAAVEGDGSAVRPFKTFAAAQKAVRTAVAQGCATLPPGEVVVKIASGRHYVAKTVKFTKQDSGTVRNPVRWCAAEKGKTRFTGGIDLPEPKPVTDPAALAKLRPEARGKVLQCDVTGTGIDLNAEGATLVWGDSFLNFSRWPNEGFTGIKYVEPRPPIPGKRRPMPGRGFTYADDRISDWADEHDAYASGYFYYDWAVAAVKIEKIDPVKKYLLQEGECTHYGYSTRGYWYGFNLLCEIDLPGEYHFAKKDGKVTVWPPAGKPAQPPQITVNNTIFQLDGVTDITIEGLVLENTRDLALLARGCEHFGLVGCSILNAGRAVELYRCRSSRVAGCEVHHCNGSGISMSTSQEDRDNLVEAGCTVENCHISDFARIRMTREYRPAIQMFGCGLAARRNLIHHGPHVAVLFSGREIHIENNEIHSVCLDSGEMGAIYCGNDWTLCGDRIVGNYLHDIGMGGKGWNPNRGCMLDDGCAGVAMLRNRFINVAEGISLSAFGNRIENNLFENVYPSVSGWQTWNVPETFKESHYTPDLTLKTFDSIRGKPWASRYPYLAQIQKARTSGVPRGPEANTTIKDNVIVGGPEKAFFFAYGSYTNAQCWTVSGNIRSKDGHEADGMLPPLSEIGVYASPERAAWPVHNPVHRVAVKDISKMAHEKAYRPMN